MNQSSKIKMTKKLNVTDLSGEKVMVDFEQGKYFMIKGVGNDIWDMLYEDITVNEIVDKLLTQYEVDRDTCIQEVMEFLEQLREVEIIEEV